MLCLPLVGDQHDNAARIVARGAGLRLSPDASPDRIRSALMRITTEKAFKEGARVLGKALALEPDPATRAADEIEQAARADQRPETGLRLGLVFVFSQSRLDDS